MGLFNTPCLPINQITLSPIHCRSLAGWRASRANTLSPVIPSAPANTPVAGMSVEDMSESEEGKAAGGKRVVEFRALGYKYEQLK